jgi:hypothetical protein
MWFIKVQQDEGNPSWRRFTKLSNLCFGPPICSNPLGLLMACKRTDTVNDYQDWLRLYSPAWALTKAQQVQAFTTGLQPPLNHDVEVHNPQSLVVDVGLARKLELHEQCAAAIAPPFVPPHD